MIQYYNISLAMPISVGVCILWITKLKTGIPSVF